MEYFNSGKIKICIVVFIIFMIMAIGTLMQINGAHHKKPGQQELEIQAIKIKKELDRKKMENQYQEQYQPSNYREQNTQSYGNNTENSNTNPESYSLSEGITAKNNGDIQKAINELRYASLSNNPNIKKSALTALAECYDQEGDKNSQISAYEELLNLEYDENTRKDLYEKIGIIHLENGNFNKALEMYKESYNINPEGYTALAICDIYEKLNDRNGIDNQIKRHLASKPQDREIFKKYETVNADNPEKKQNNEPEKVSGELIDEQSNQ